MTSIPASALVQINPGVVSAGGSGLDLVELILTNSTRAPIGSVLRFSSAADVSTYFGPVSQEATLAAIYFAGFTGSTITPASLLFAQYPAAAVPAYLRGGNLSALTLAQLQALTPATITMSIDGRSVTSGTITLSSATSFSNAAAIIATALADKDASFTGVIAVTTGILTASSVTGTIAVGQTIAGSGVPAGTIVTSQIGGTPGGAGTYQTNIVTAVSSTAMTSGNTTVAYDSVSSAFVITAGTPGATGAIGFASSALATSLALTAATGAVISQGAAAGVPGTAMDSIVAATQDFYSFTTTFEPITADALLFAAWANGKNNRFKYITWDTDITVTTNTDTSSLIYQITQLGYSSTEYIYAPINQASIAVAAGAITASTDFTRTNGRWTSAFRNFPGLVADVTNQTIADNIKANKGNFYGSYATANAQFTVYYPGQISGPFLWDDSHADQAWMNNGFQLALLTLLTTIGSIPYNAAGYAMIETAMLDQINSAVAFGAIRAGVTLSALQIQQVNTQAGKVINDTLSQRGWYILVNDPTAAIRAARGSPTVTVWWVDGQSVQKLVVSSLEVQ